MFFKLLSPSLRHLNMVKNLSKDLNLNSPLILNKHASLSSSSLYIFDREAKRVQRNRTSFDPDYKHYEYVKSEVGYRVADRVFDIKRNFDTILDLGCQRGYVSKNLTKVILPLSLTPKQE